MFTELYSSIANFVPTYNSDAPPASPANGTLWWESDTGTLYISFNDGNSTQWVAVSGNPPVVPKQAVVTKAANYSVVATDHNAIINVSGSWTLSHTITASQAGAGFTYWVRNTGTATITIDPAGSELIDGTATLFCLAKQQFQVVCDGAQWFTLGREGKVKQPILTFSSVSSMVIPLPPNYTSFDIDVIDLTMVSTFDYFSWRYANNGVPNFVASGSYYYQGTYSGGGAVAAAGFGTAGDVAGRFTNQMAPGNSFDVTCKFRPYSLMGGANRFCQLSVQAGGLFDSGGLCIQSNLNTSAVCNTAPATHLLIYSTGGTIFSCSVNVYGNV
jgi:hypothetical protein